MRRTVRKTLALGAAACAALALTQASTAHAAAPAPPYTTVIGRFGGTPTGVSVFTQDAGTINTFGQYFNLRANRSYFTVIYGNNNCDPAQAFPVGPFNTDGRGRVAFTAATPNPNGIIVGQSGSVSVRRGDNQTDIDGDGLLGPTDVVAVAGKPWIGLIQCDSRPVRL